MPWLNAASVIMTALAGMSIGLASLVLFRRARAVRLGWTGKVLLLLLLIAALLHLASEIDPTILPLAGWTLCASVIMLAVAAVIWPFIQHITAQFSQATDDIVGRRLDLAETSAIESRRWLELAEKIAHIGHWRYTIADRKLVWSDEIYQIYGVSRDRFTLTVETALAPYLPEDRPLVAGIFDNALTNPGPFECSARLLRADGALRHVQSRGIAQSDQTGAVVAIFGVFADVTDQKKVEQELKEAHALSEYSNRALQEMAMQDSLTGLPNRRHFDAALAQEFKRANRDNAELSVIMIDLDYFKGFNDCYGHPAGDECLRRVAEAIASVPQRPADLVARYGGEELVILLPNTTAAGAAIVARLAGEAVRQLGIPHLRNPGRIVTVSCGVASFAPGMDPQVPIMLVERADQALYRAKLAGRNRVTTYAEVAAQG